MPFLQVMANRANARLAFGKVNRLARKSVQFAPDASLRTVADQLGISQTVEERAVLDSVPGALQRAIVGVIGYALNRDAADRMQVTVSWSPAYEYAVKVWEARAVGKSPPALTIHIEGPYPDHVGKRAR